MSKYDDLFEDVAPTDNVFADNDALDPFKEPDEIVSREKQEEELARILAGSTRDISRRQFRCMDCRGKAEDLLQLFPHSTIPPERHS